MTTVEEFNLRLSATKDVLVGLQKSDLALVRLDEDELRLRVRSLVSFLAGTHSDGTRPPWLAEVASSAEDYLVECLQSSMGPEHSPPNSLSSAKPAVDRKAREWWRFWG